MIYITGDTHGEQNRILYIEQKSGIKDKDYLIVCGDFGYIFTDSLTERHFLDDLEARPYTICFCDGNHENFPAIYNYPKETWNGGRIHRIRKNSAGQSLLQQFLAYLLTGTRLDSQRRRQGLSR